MNRMMIWTAALGLAAVAATGCNSGQAPTEAGSGYVPKKPVERNNPVLAAGSEADYFPFSAGSQWTFDSEASQMVNGNATKPVKAEVTWRLSEVKPSPNGGKDAYFAILSEDKIVDRQVWHLDKHGISQVALGLKLNKFSTPQTILPFPVKVGAKFKWTGTVKSEKGEVRSGTIEGTIVGPEPIDTPMGSFNALAVESRGGLSGATNKSEIASRVWLVPKIGIGRYRQEMAGQIPVKNPKVKGQTVPFVVVQVLKLKNYSPKK